MDGTRKRTRAPPHFPQLPGQRGEDFACTAGRDEFVTVAGSKTIHVAIESFLLVRAVFKSLALREIDLDFGAGASDIPVNRKFSDYCRADRTGGNKLIN